MGILAAGPYGAPTTGGTDVEPTAIPKVRVDIALNVPPRVYRTTRFWPAGVLPMVGDHVQFSNGDGGGSPGRHVSVSAVVRSRSFVATGEHVIVICDLDFDPFAPATRGEHERAEEFFAVTDQYGWESYEATP